jgi:hypothetical protein
MRFYLFYISIFFLYGCYVDTFTSENSTTLEEEKFIEVYEDVLVLENYYQIKYGLPSVYKNALENSCKKIFEKHKIKKQDFEKSFDYYAHRPEQLKSINQQIIARLNKKKL